MENKQAYGTPSVRNDINENIGGGGPQMPKPQLEVWSVDRILETLGNGRSVLVVYEDATTKTKLVPQLQEVAIEHMGEPITTRAPGQNYDAVYWSSEVALGAGLHSPEELLKQTPAKTDVVRLAVPAGWN